VTICVLAGMGIPYLFPVQMNAFNPIFDSEDVIVQASEFVKLLIISPMKAMIYRFKFLDLRRTFIALVFFGNHCGSKV